MRSFCNSVSTLAEFEIWVYPVGGDPGGQGTQGRVVHVRPCLMYWMNRNRDSGFRLVVFNQRPQRFWHKIRCGQVSAQSDTRSGERTVSLNTIRCSVHSEALVRISTPDAQSLELDGQSGCHPRQTLTEARQNLMEMR